MCGGRRLTGGAVADDELALGFFRHSDLRKDRGTRSYRHNRKHLFDWKHLSGTHQVGVITRDAETTGAGSRSGNFAALLLRVDPAPENNSTGG